MDEGEIAYDSNTGEIGKVSLPDPVMEAVQSDPPSDWQEKNYRYDPDTDSYTEAAPDPDTAYAEIEQLLIDAFKADGAEDEEIEAMDLMNRYDVVINALQRGNYDRVARFTESKIQPNEAIVDDKMVSDIKDVLKVS